MRLVKTLIVGRKFFLEHADFAIEARKQAACCNVSPRCDASLGESKEYVVHISTLYGDYLHAT